MVEDVRQERHQLLNTKELINQTVWTTEGRNLRVAQPELTPSPHKVGPQALIRGDETPLNAWVDHLTTVCIVRAGSAIEARAWKLFNRVKPLQASEYTDGGRYVERARESAWPPKWGKMKRLTCYA